MSKDSTAAQAVNTFDGGIDKATTDKWKAQHRKVTRIEVQDGDEVHVGYFKRPNMETMTAQVLFDGCWLGGSEALRQDAVLFTACMGQLNKAFVAVSASLKNL